MKQISVPLEFIAQLSRIRLPYSADTRMRELIQRRRDSALSDRENAELENLLQLSENFLQLGAEAQTCLNLYGPNANGIRIEIRNGLPVMVPPDGTSAIDTESIRRIREEEGF